MKPVKEVMAKDLAYCNTDTKLSEVARMMEEHDIGAVPICSDNRELLGMVTDRDLVVRGYGNDKSGSASIQEVMSDHLVTANPDTTVQEASEMMAEHQIRRLPVVERGELVGMVSLGDLALEEKSNQAAGHALEEISERPELH